MQSHLHSFLEACANTASGFLISLLTASIVFPLFGFQSNMSQNFAITSIFTVVSIARSYLWRRVFNCIHRPRSA